jgi:hypothetical protein
MYSIGELPPILVFTSSSIVRAINNIHPIVPFSHVTLPISIYTVDIELGHLRSS